MTGYRIVRNSSPVGAVLAIGVLVAAMIIVAWPKPHYAVFRRMCTAEGGITVRTLDGPVCIWAGAVIQVTP